MSKTEIVESKMVVRESSNSHARASSEVERVDPEQERASEIINANVLDEHGRKVSDDEDDGETNRGCAPT